MSSRTAARRVASTPVDSLRKRERQIMAAAYDLAKKDGAFSISFVAKKTSVKALIYFSAPKSAVGHADAEEPEDVEDEAVVEEGGRAMPSSAKEPHRARREAGPATAPPMAAKRPSRPQNGTNVHSAQGTMAKAAKGKRPAAARVDRNALSARTDGASKRPHTSSQPSAAGPVCGRADSWLVRRGTRAGGDAMDEDEGPLTQEVASVVRTAPQRTYVDALSCGTWGGHDPPSSDGGWSPG